MLLCLFIQVWKLYSLSFWWESAGLLCFLFTSVLAVGLAPLIFFLFTSVLAVGLAPLIIVLGGFYFLFTSILAVGLAPLNIILGGFYLCLVFLLLPIFVNKIAFPSVWVFVPTASGCDKVWISFFAFSFPLFFFDVLRPPWFQAPNKAFSRRVAPVTKQAMAGWSSIN
jgi:hypothetical protein